MALGGSIGAIARYAIANAFIHQQIKFPLSTLLVNILGAFLMGAGYSVIVEKALVPIVWRHALMVGFLGAFTTYSTFALESVLLLQNGYIKDALLYAVLSVIGTILAAFIGMRLVESLF